MTASCFAQFGGQESSFDRQLRTRDDQPLKQFVESKEDIDVKKKADNLDISGDVRFEYQKIKEKGIVYYERDDSPGSSFIFGSGEPFSSDGPYHTRYRNLRDHAGSDGIPLSSNNLDVEFNLKMKYTQGKAWAYAHLQFDNPTGIRGPLGCVRTIPVFDYDGNKVLDLNPVNTKNGLKASGFAGAINLKRAMLGYTLFEQGDNSVEIQFGRWKFDDEFVSEVQFSNRFDGVLFKIENDFLKDFSGFYCNVGSFVVDQAVNHFGYIGEIGFMDILETGLDVRYSLIDWQKRGRNRCGKENPIGSDFVNSQISFSYNIKPTLFCDYKLPIEVYGGFLINHAAKKTRFTHGEKENLAAYGGVTFGQVRKKGDWSLDLEYIYIQAQAVPDDDVGSIGRGNILREGLYDILVAEKPESSEASASESEASSSDNEIYIYPRRGNANFVGFRAEFLYALTDNFSFDVIYEFSNEISRKIGGRHFYSDFEIEAVYAF